MRITNIHEAKTRLSQLIERVQAGEEVIIGKAGVPVAKLIRYNEREVPRRPGYWRGKLMKPTAYLVNTARGPIVDEAGLIKALGAGWIAGAGLDVFSQEPPTNNPLLSIENVVLGPHVAASTEEALYRMGRGAAENVVNVFEGKQPLGVVNPS